MQEHEGQQLPPNDALTQAEAYAANEALSQLTEQNPGFERSINGLPVDPTARLEMAEAGHEAAQAEARLRIKQLDREASYDALTGLSNKASLAGAAERAEAENASVGERVHYFTFLDAEKFKVINDTYGQAVGDEVIAYLASNVLKAAQGYGLTERHVFRAGGDEFIVITSAFKNASLDLSAEEVAKHITDDVNARLQVPFYLTGPDGPHDAISLQMHTQIGPTYAEAAHKDKPKSD